MATQKRDLRSGRSVWEARRLPRIQKETLTRDQSCDVVVVGAGISGALAAELLSDAGLRVCVVDRRGPAQGSTSASTALLQYELDVPLARLARQMERERAERIWRRSYLSVRALAERTRRLGIDAGLEARDTLYLSGNELAPRALAEEGEARRRAGFEVEYLTVPETFRRFGIEGRACLRNAGNLVADPRRLTAGYLSRAVEQGARIFAGEEVAEVESGRDEVRALTRNGPVIRARHLVYATGYELPHVVPRTGHQIISTWAMATRPQSLRTWPSDHMIWEASDPYLYLRAGPGGCIICGGEDEEFSDDERRDALLPRKTQILQEKLARLLPGVDATAAYSWTGNFGASDDGTPTVGAVPGAPGCYAVLGYGGNGITFSMMAAQILRGLIAGDGDPDEELFAFGR